MNGRVARLLGLTEEQQTVPHKNGSQSEFEYRMAWARTYLKFAGALENPSTGVWSITDLGRSLTAAGIPNILRSVRHAQALRRKDGSPKTLMDGAVSASEPELGADNTWRVSLLDLLKGMPPDRFERLCQRLLREVGFTEVTVLGRTGDGGIDGMGILRAALLSSRVYFQCKRYAGSVPASAVRDFCGAMSGRGDKGLLLTTGSFTSQAIQEATREGAPIVDLVDGHQLCDLLKDYQLGIRQAVVVDAAWFETV